MSNDPLLDQFNRMMPLFERATGDNWSQYDQALADLLARYEEEEDPDELGWIRMDLEELVGEMAPNLWEWANDPREAEIATIPSRGIDGAKGIAGDVMRSFVKEFARPQEAAIGARGGEMFDEMSFALDDANVAPDDDSGPATVTRFTDITCPRQVWVESPRIPVTVRLTLAPVEASAATAAMDLRTDLPVSVTIDAFGFDVLEAHTIDLDVPPDEDSARITFMLKPRSPGQGRVILEFRQAGNLAGAVSLDVLISAQPVQEIPTQYSGLPLAFEDGAPTPDRTLMIGYGWADGQYQLTFRLFQGDVLREAFPPKRLSTDVEAYVADLYSQLTRHADEATDHLDPAKQAEAERLIRQIGRKLWRDILPPPLQAIYLDEWQSWQDSTLLIVSDEPHLPWELIWPFERGWAGPDQPWCLSMNLGPLAAGSGERAGHARSAHPAALATLQHHRAVGCWADLRPGGVGHPAPSDGQPRHGRPQPGPFRPSRRVGPLHYRRIRLDPRRHPRQLPGRGSWPPLRPLPQRPRNPFPERLVGPGDRGSPVGEPARHRLQHLR